MPTHTTTNNNKQMLISKRRELSRRKEILENRQAANGGRLPASEANDLEDIKRELDEIQRKLEDKGVDSTAVPAPEPEDPFDFIAAQRITEPIKKSKQKTVSDSEIAEMHGEKQPSDPVKQEDTEVEDTEVPDSPATQQTTEEDTATEPGFFSRQRREEQREENNRRQRERMENQKRRHQALTENRRQERAEITDSPATQQTTEEDAATEPGFFRRALGRIDDGLTGFANTVSGGVTGFANTVSGRGQGQETGELPTFEDTVQPEYEGKPHRAVAGTWTRPSTGERVEVEDLTLATVFGDYIQGVEENVDPQQRVHNFRYLEDVLAKRGVSRENSPELIRNLYDIAVTGIGGENTERQMELTEGLLAPLILGEQEQEQEQEGVDQSELGIPPVPETLMQTTTTPGYWQDVPQDGGGMAAMNLAGGPQSSGDTITPMSDSYLNPLRKDIATREAAAMNDPMRSDPLLNFHQREKIQEEKEKATRQYGAALHELMRRSENRAMAANITRALGRIAAGTIGLTTGLAVSKYYDPGEAENPAEYYQAMAPMLEQKHAHEQQRFDELAKHYEDALGFYLQNTEVAKALVGMQQNHIQANLQYLQVVGNLRERQQQLNMAGQGDMAKELQVQQKMLEAAYDTEINRAEEEISEIQEGLGRLRDQVATEYESDRFKQMRETLTKVSSSNAANQSKWGIAREAFRGSNFQVDLLDKLHDSLKQDAMETEGMNEADAEAFATKEVFARAYEFGQTNPATYLNEVTATGVIPANQLDNIARYNMLYSTFFNDNSNPLDNEALNILSERLAEAKHIRNHYESEKVKALQQLVAGGSSRQWVPGTQTQTSVGTGRQVPLAPAVPPAGDPTSPEFLNPSQRRDMSGYLVAGNRGNYWSGLNISDIGDRGVKRGGTYYLPAHVTNDKEFMAGIYDTAADAGVTPEGLLAIMALETANTFHPAVVNPSGATGLIQFMPSTARGLLTDVVDQNGEPVKFTDTEAQKYMASLPRNEQLPYVAAYFKSAINSGYNPYKNRPLDAGQLYSLVLMGARGAREGWSIGSQNAKQNGSIVEGVKAIRRARGENNITHISGADVAEYFNKKRAPREFKAKQGATPLQSTPTSTEDIPPPPSNLGG